MQSSHSDQTSSAVMATTTLSQMEIVTILREDSRLSQMENVTILRGDFNKMVRHVDTRGTCYVTSLDNHENGVFIPLK